MIFVAQWNQRFKSVEGKNGVTIPSEPDEINLVPPSLQRVLTRIFHNRPKREVESLVQCKEVVKKRVRHIEHMLSEAFVRLTQECQGFRRRSRLGNEISGLNALYRFSAMRKMA